MPCRTCAAYPPNSWPRVTGVASIRCVRPDFTTCANSSALWLSDAARWSSAGIRSAVTAAVVNAELGVLDKDLAEAVRSAAEEVASGRWDDQFPVDVFQTGSGTSSNMNMNEVVATLATERLGSP
ncbi:hypothetical protein KDA82_40500, partial [Streptomyces daliensis]|nr:hypothetical protein [Streptomyces daliensis]